MVTVELLPDSVLVALGRFCAIQMAVIIIIITIIINTFSDRLMSRSDGGKLFNTVRLIATNL